jgi:lipoyl(octanoyl) transferase
MDYGRALSVQHRLHAARAAGRVPDVLMVTEHGPTVTLGRRAGLTDLPLGASALAARGIALYAVGRGGRATFHGPGQLVAYPLVDLRALALGPARFVGVLEEAMVEVLSDLGVAAATRRAGPGVWVGDRKIGAIGVEIVGGVSRHGLAVNLRGDMSAFAVITACGIARSTVVALEDLGVTVPTRARVGAALAGAIGRRLDLAVCAVAPDIVTARLGVVSTARASRLGAAG